MPKGMKAMGALANAAVATFLVEAFQRYVAGYVLAFIVPKIEKKTPAGAFSGFLGSVIFKNHKIIPAEVVRGTV